MTSCLRAAVATWLPANLAQPHFFVKNYDEKEPLMVFLEIYKAIYSIKNPVERRTELCFHNVRLSTG